MSAFPERLKELRQSHNAPQAILAELMGITPRSYRRYEEGKREPKIDALIRLANYFEVTVDYLIGRDLDSSSGKRQEN